MSLSDPFDTFLFGGSREFDVESGDFSQLEIRQGGNQGFYYFYHKADHRLVTDFVISERPHVTSICTVTLIFSDETYSPRLKFWKKDKKKAAAAAAAIDLEIADLPQTRAVKALVDTSDGHKNLWKLINYLQTCDQLTLPQEQFKIVTADVDQLAEILKGNDKSTLVGMMSKVLAGNVTQADLDLIANRKGHLDLFDRLITEPDYMTQLREYYSTGMEGVWQRFFQANPWIFGYGLTLIPRQSYDEQKLEQITTGANIFGGGGKRVDALLRTRGVVSSLVFCEIKHHETDLLDSSAYRPHDVYRPSREMVGAVSQVQKTTDKAVRYLRDYLHQHIEPDGTRAEFEIATIRPKRIVVAGVTRQLESGKSLNAEKVAALELYRRSINDVEIITFDELLARARFIVADV